MISGLYWPLDNTAFALLPFSNLLPLSIPIRAVHAILIRGRQFNTDKIIYAVITITFWILISFTTFIFKLRNKINFIF